jgi:hypothetical protein
MNSQTEMPGKRRLRFFDADDAGLLPTAAGIKIKEGVAVD